MHHFRPVFVLCRKNLSQLLEGGDLVEGYSIGSECPPLPLPCLLLRQSMPLPLHSPSAKVHRKVLAVKGLLWHKHVALAAPGVRLATLLQDHNFIPHVAVLEVNPEVGTTRHTTQEPL